MKTLQKILGIGAFSLLSGCERDQAGSNSATAGSGFPVPVVQEVKQPSEYIEGIVVREGGTLTRALESGTAFGRDIDLSYVIIFDATEGRYALELAYDPNKSRTALAESIEPGDRIRVLRSWASIHDEDKIGSVWTRAVQLIAKKDQVKAEKEYSADKKS